MRCPFCSQNIKIQGKFCPKCGKQIFGLPVQRPEGSETGTPPPVESPQAPFAPGPPAPAPPIPTPGGSFRPPPPPAPPIPGAHRPGDSDVLDIELSPVETSSGPPMPTAPSFAPGRGSAAPGPGGGIAPITAPKDEVGKNCPYCRFPIKISESIVVCDACKTPHHQDCWQENGGCTSYGCARAPGARPQAAATAAGYPPSAGAGPARPAGNAGTVIASAMEGLIVQELERAGSNALMYSLIGMFGMANACCLPILIFSIIGVLMGFSALSSIQRSGFRAARPRRRAIAAVIIGGMTIILYVIVWFGPLLAKTNVPYR